MGSKVREFYSMSTHLISSGHAESICVTKRNSFPIFLGDLTAVFTPLNRITTSEVLPGGSCIVLATEGSSNLTILRLVGPNVPPQPQAASQPEIYGLPENANKEFDLSEER